MSRMLGDMDDLSDELKICWFICSIKMLRLRKTTEMWFNSLVSRHPEDYIIENISEYESLLSDMELDFQDSFVDH